MSKSHVRPDQPTEPAIGLLQPLAARGAYLAAGTPGCPPGSYAIYAPDNGFDAPVANLSAPVVSACRAAGWLAQHGSDRSRLALSREGVVALKRRRSGGGRNDNAGMPAFRAPNSTPIRDNRQRATVAPARDPLLSPLAWLRRRKGKDGKPFLSRELFEAGERLAADFMRGHMLPRVTADWSSAAPSRRGPRSAPGFGVEIADAVIAAQTRVRRALSAVGPELAGILIDVCCHEKGIEQVERDLDLPQRAGKSVLRIALAGLARHYGLIPPPAPVSQHVRHWGTADYRPDLDEWQDDGRASGGIRAPE